MFGKVGRKNLFVLLKSMCSFGLHFVIKTLTFSRTFFAFVRVGVGGVCLFSFLSLKGENGH